MEMIIDVLADALADCLKMLPFLFAASGSGKRCR